VNTSRDLGRRPERKESLGAGVVVRERLIRDLESGVILEELVGMDLGYIGTAHENILKVWIWG